MTLYFKGWCHLIVFYCEIFTSYNKFSNFFKPCQLGICPRYRLFQCCHHLFFWPGSQLCCGDNHRGQPGAFIPRNHDLGNFRLYQKFSLYPARAILSPPEFTIISFFRPVMVIKPSSEISAISPVYSQPSCKACFVASGFCQ